MLGEKPDNVLTDSGNAAGSVLAGPEDRNITAFAPAKSSEPTAGSPVRRDDLTQPVPESQWPLLKLSDRKQLDKSCFVYDEKLDQYFCPMGRVLNRTDKEIRNGVLLTRDRSLDCSDCPLASKCIQKHENPESRRSMRTVPLPQAEFDCDRRRSFPDGCEIRLPWPHPANPQDSVRLKKRYRRFGVECSCDSLCSRHAPP
jgi:hypothetical protein